MLKITFINVNIFDIVKIEIELVCSDFVSFLNIGNSLKVKIEVNMVCHCFFNAKMVELSKWVRIRRSNPQTLEYQRRHFFRMEYKYKRWLSYGVYYIFKFVCGIEYGESFLCKSKRVNFKFLKLFGFLDVIFQTLWEYLRSLGIPEDNTYYLGLCIAGKVTMKTKSFSVVSDSIFSHSCHNHGHVYEPHHWEAARQMATNSTHDFVLESLSNRRLRPLFLRHLSDLHFDQQTCRR